jgi:hypothetical protein
MKSISHRSIDLLDVAELQRLGLTFYDRTDAALNMCGMDIASPFLIAFVSTCRTATGRSRCLS